MSPVGRTFDTLSAARYLDIHKDTLLRAYRRGKLRGTKDTMLPGSPIRFLKEDLDAYRERKQEANIEP